MMLAFLYLTFILLAEAASAEAVPMRTLLIYVLTFETFFVAASIFVVVIAYWHSRRRWHIWPVSIGLSTALFSMDISLWVPRWAASNWFIAVRIVTVAIMLLGIQRIFDMRTILPTDVEAAGGLKAPAPPQ